MLTLLAAAIVTACGGDDEASVPALPEIPLATGSGVTSLPEAKGPFFDITAYGAVAGGPALANQAAINNAIDAAAAAGGGTVTVPSGDFKTYTIRLKSNVGLRLAQKDSVLRAAVSGTGAGQDGGFYDAPEVNPFVGLQDQGHSHWANSLIYGVDVENVMISGPGMIDGSYVDPATGFIVNVLSGNDPSEVSVRTAAGTPGGANKAIALKNAKNIVFRDFVLKNGGHFGIIGTGVVGWTLDGIVIDGNRDAIDIDSSQNVTMRNSIVNSLTDDAIVLKGSFGLGRYMATKNVLIEDCTVSGYDPGSVIAGTYTTNKLVATDRDGPTARVKLGTEGTTGFDTITVRRIAFERSRGFALESVDGAELQNIVFADSTMKNVSSSPIYVRLGDRGRAPVTGTSADAAVSPANTVRLDDRGWVLPNNAPVYGNFPIVRYVPSYAKTTTPPIGGASTPFTIVNPTAPIVANPNSTLPTDATAANAVGVGFAKVRNIRISGITVEDADPRYPIILAGLVDQPIENVSFDNVKVQYRGGLKMEHAIEQRQLNQNYAYTAYQAAPTTQSLPWLANTFFSKNEALLPRVSWSTAANNGAGGWADDPYNIPEMPREYPEPSNFGVLPAYGMYARHVKNLRVSNVEFSFKVDDERPAVVLDDVSSGSFDGFKAQVKTGTPAFVKVTNNRKRVAVREYVLNEPYKKTTVTDVRTPDGLAVQEVTIDRPAPGTPQDTLYTLPTAPSASAPYAYAVPDASYPRPLTVYRPSIAGIATSTAVVGQSLTFVVNGVSAIEGASLSYSAGTLPAGASFDTGSRRFSWTPTAAQVGKQTVEFIVDDGVIPQKRQFTITVKAS
jgi:polygalacturonase